MKLKCRICGVVIDYEGFFNTEGHSGGAMRQHLQQHKWQILRLIQGIEGDGSFARFLEALLFAGVNGPDETEPYAELGAPLSTRQQFEYLQLELLSGARNTSAVDSDLKGAPKSAHHSISGGA